MTQERSVTPAGVRLSTAAEVSSQEVSMARSVAGMR
jgi:hypothetical protein